MCIGWLCRDQPPVGPRGSRRLGVYEASGLASMVGVNPRVFISYRRADSAGWSGRIFDHLTRLLGAENVVLDVGVSRRERTLVTSRRVMR